MTGEAARQAAIRFNLSIVQSLPTDAPSRLVPATEKSLQRPTCHVAQLRHGVTYLSGHQGGISKWTGQLGRRTRAPTSSDWNPSYCPPLGSPEEFIPQRKTKTSHKQQENTDVEAPHGFFQLHNYRSIFLSLSKSQTVYYVT